MEAERRAKSAHLHSQHIVAGPCRGTVSGRAAARHRGPVSLSDATVTEERRAGGSAPTQLTPRAVTLRAARPCSPVSDGGGDGLEEAHSMQ